MTEGKKCKMCENILPEDDEKSLCDKHLIIDKFTGYLAKPNNEKKKLIKELLWNGADVL